MLPLAHSFLSKIIITVAIIIPISLVNAQSHAKGDGWEYFCVGNCDNDVTTSVKAGLILMGGGTDVDDAFKFLNGNSGGGDVLVIRTTGTDAYNSYIYEFGGVNSAATIILSQGGNTSADPFVLKKVHDCEGLFFAGGDQSTYYNYWKFTPLQTMFDYLIHEKGITMGGTSAGMMIQAAYPYTAQFDSVTSGEALYEPYDPLITIGFNMIQHKLLENTIMDTHFVERDRMGRQITFMARLLRDRIAPIARGIAIDQATAILVDATGKGQVVAQLTTTNNTNTINNNNNNNNNNINNNINNNNNNKRDIYQNNPSQVAYLLSASSVPEVCAPGSSLTFRGVNVDRLRPGDTVDLALWESNGDHYTLSAVRGVLQSSGNGPSNNIY